MEEVDRLARKPDSVVISCGMKLNLDYLLEVLWEYLALTCIYTKKRGRESEGAEPRPRRPRPACLPAALHPRLQTPA